MLGCWAAASPKRFCRGRNTGARRELPCLAGPAPARVVSEKTRETKEKPAGRDLVGHNYVVSRLSIDQQQHSTAGPGKVNPSKEGAAERAEEEPEDSRAWHGIA